MIQPVLLLFGATTFSFSGGTDNDLVAEIAKKTERPVVMLASQGNRWKKAKFDYRSSEEFRQRVFGSFGVRLAPNGAASTDAWQRGMGYLMYWERYRRLHKPCPTHEDFSDGFVSLRTVDNEALTLYDLSGLGMSKHLSWERFFERVRLRLDVRHLTEDELLEAIASAIGAKRIESGRQVKFVIDPKQYRSRSMALWKSVLANPEDAYERANAEYMLALLPLTPDRLISQAFNDPERPGGWAQTWQPGTAVHSLAWQRPIQFFLQQGKEPDETFRRVAQPDHPIWAYIEDTGVPRVGYRNLKTDEVVIF